MIKRFLKAPFLFAGKHKCILAIASPHVTDRWNLRVNKTENPSISEHQCLCMIAKLLSDQRLSDVFVRAGEAHVVVFIQESRLYIMMAIESLEEGGKCVKVFTVLLADTEQSGLDNRCFVNSDDLCYVLPESGELRFGKEKKFFKFKKFKTQAKQYHPKLN